ncbi:MAG: serine hydrolase [Terriglobia bacterium]|nr:serine hydrolase [Terriglobia bacterium]
MVAISKLTGCIAVIWFASQLLIAQAASSSQTLSTTEQQHIAKVISCLPGAVVVKDDPQPCSNLSERMAQFHIPGASIAVIHNGSIEWAQGFGVKQVGGALVDAATLFQAGSISKPLAAMAALHQVQEKKILLDADVNTELISWKVPDSKVANGKDVTLRELLTHTAGFTVHGFPGYAAGEPVPTLIQVLDGEKPANTEAIVLESEPGSKWNYSGGGYIVMQQMLLDATKELFPKLMHDTVLAPIGMTHSTYEQPLPADLKPNAATPYDGHGAAVPGGAHTYPEMAAAGLWTTPSDLARYCIEVEQSLQGKANHVLSQNLTEQMLTPGKGDWGLGVEIGGSAADPYFTHGGVNDGFDSLFVAYEHHGDGAVVMTNAQGGSFLAEEVMRSIAVEYGWADFHPVVRTEVKIDPKVLARYVGTYAPNPNFNLTFTVDGDQLMTQVADQPKIPIFPESQTKFFLKIVDTEVEFFTNDTGEVSYLILHQNGHDIKAMKK